MKRLFVTVVALLLTLQPTTVTATTLTNRVTGVDQSGNPVTLYCSGAHCHDTWGYIYGDPRTVTGDLWKVKPAARGYTWAWVGPVTATCQPDTTVVGFELVCSW